jgi:hypothetical protein
MGSALMSALTLGSVGHGLSLVASREALPAEAPRAAAVAAAASPSNAPADGCATQAVGTHAVEYDVQIELDDDDDLRVDAPSPAREGALARARAARLESGTRQRPSSEAMQQSEGDGVKVVEI